jgi:hypothetical protein
MPDPGGSILLPNARKPQVPIDTSSGLITESLAARLSGTTLDSSAISLESATFHPGCRFSDMGVMNEPTVVMAEATGNLGGRRSFSSSGSESSIGEARTSAWTSRRLITRPPSRQEQLSIRPPPRFLPIAGDQFSARELAAVVSEVTGKEFRPFRAGRLGALAMLIKIARTVAPGERELYPAWQGMQYVRNMFDGRAKLDPLDNNR